MLIFIKIFYRIDRETYSYKLFRWLIYGRIKSAIGFDRCKLFISAAAPISVELKKYFMSLDIPLCEVIRQLFQFIFSYF